MRAIELAIQYIILIVIIEMGQTMCGERYESRDPFVYTINSILSVLILSLIFFFIVYIININSIIIVLLIQAVC